jgi:hypothetical protein
MAVTKFKLVLSTRLDTLDVLSRYMEMDTDSLQHLIYFYLNNGQCPKNTIPDQFRISLKYVQTDQQCKNKMVWNILIFKLLKHLFIQELQIRKYGDWSSMVG